MIKRKIFNDLVNHLNRKEISLIIGPRQAGKTTLMIMLKSYLEKQGEKTLYLNLDIEEDSMHFDSQIKFLQKLKLEVGRKKAFIFIDEIQRKTNAGLFLKGLYDRNLPYKFIVSGSGSMELKEKIHESLVGRKRIFELSTISFEEFADYKTSYKYDLHEFFKTEPERTMLLLNEYLSFGGYPALIVEEEKREKLYIMQEIFKSYLEKDIRFLLNVDKVESFSGLIKLLALQEGNLVNYQELTNNLSISFATLKNYLWFAEKTFIIRKNLPFFINKRKEIVKRPVYYFYDLGFRNFAAGSFGLLRGGKETGFIFENLIFNILKELTMYSSAEIRFWRTKDGAEVDFIVSQGNESMPIEVKFSRLKEPKMERSLASFIKKYKPAKAFVVNLSLDVTVKRGTEANSTEVYFIPFWKLPYILLQTLIFTPQTNNYPGA